MTNVELYQALKGSIPDEAAKLIAEVFPRVEDLSTKSHVDLRFAELRGDVLALRSHIDQKIAEVRGEIHAEGKHAMRWMLGLFLPVWAATLGTLIVALVKL